MDKAIDPELSIFHLFRSTLIKKAVMALTGVVLYGFVLGHMVGNLKAFQGSEKFNHYAEFLREMGSPFLPHGGALWIARIGLLACLVLHVLAAWQITQAQRRARPERYAVRRAIQMDWASRSMGWSGLVILIYVIFHLMHLTIGNVHPDFVPGDAYWNLTTGLAQPLVAVFYVVAVGLLGLHLYHGLWSLFQTLGLEYPRYDRWRRIFAITFAVTISLGFMAVPIAVLIGIL